MQEDKVKTLSRGQKKRLEKKINRFATAEAIKQKRTEHLRELDEAKRGKQKALSDQQKAERQMNKSFSMDVENSGKPKSAFGNMEGLDNILNSIVKK